MAKRKPSVAMPKKQLEDYDPGATQEQVLAGLRKAISIAKKPSESPGPASSKT